MEVNTSEFAFIRYRINKCNYEILGEAINVKLKFNININGDIDKEKNIFKLFMNVDIQGEGKLTIHLEAEAEFSYKGFNKPQLCSFMGLNAPAVLYPYIRSYVTMMTVNACLQPLVLPTLNLSEIGMKMAKDLMKQL